jgi:hypothetical protein
MAGNTYWSLSFVSFQHILEWYNLQLNTSFHRALISGERFVIKKGDHIDWVGVVINEKSVTIPWTSLFRRVRNIAKSNFWLRQICPSVCPSMWKTELLTWGHLWVDRMEEYRMVRRIFEWRPMGRRSRGRPRNRLRDDILKDIRLLWV